MSKVLKEAFKNMTKVLELAEKPEGDEFKQMMKMTLIGFVIVGIIAFAIATGLYYLMSFLGIATLS
uniref:Protein translocase SEC61 complex subunit gamma n=1 Tax=Ignisphaera aggregans TaxID=334771 RepID=A0A7J2U1H2_9CREN